MNQNKLTKKNVFTIEWQGDDHNQINSLDDFFEMRDWQKHAFEKLKVKPFMIFMLKFMKVM